MENLKAEFKQLIFNVASDYNLMSEKELSEKYEKCIDDFIMKIHRAGREKIIIPKKIDVQYFKNHPDFEIIYLQKYEGRFKHKNRNVEIFVSSLNQASLIVDDRFIGIIFDYEQMNNFLST